LFEDRAGSALLALSECAWWRLLQPVCPHPTPDSNQLDWGQVRLLKPAANHTHHPTVILKCTKVNVNAHTHTLDTQMRRRALTEKKLEEWAGRKGFPLLQDRQPSRGPAGRQVHSRCLLPADPCRPGPRPRVQPDNPRQPWNPSTNPTGPPPRPAASEPPHAAAPRRDNRPTEISSPEPDLRGSVTLSVGAGGHPQYTARWEGSPRRAPDLPLDTLARGLFPKAFPGRMASQPRSVLDLPRLRVATGQSAASPWTEVALHLPEVLEPGHY